LRILLTGAAGFIGHHLAQKLLEEGHYVVGVDHLKPAYEGNLPQIRLETILRNSHRRNFEFYNLDLVNPETINFFSAIEPFQVIIHLAAYPGVRRGEAEATKYYKNNVASHSAVFEIAKFSKDVKILYASSSSVYGDLGAQGAVSEDMAKFSDIKSVYGSTKWINELQSDQFFKNFGLQSIGLRFFTVFGSQGRPDMAYSIFARNIEKGMQIPILADLDSLRDYTYINDLMSQILLIVQSLQHMEHELYCDLSSNGSMKLNLGLSSPKKLSEIIYSIEIALNKKARLNHLPHQPTDSIGTYADNTKMRKYFPEIKATNFQDAINETLKQGKTKWYMD
jgi:UDP-glucuronate 4-epimerase